MQQSTSGQPPSRCNAFIYTQLQNYMSELSERILREGVGNLRGLTPQTETFAQILKLLSGAKTDEQRAECLYEAARYSVNFNATYQRSVGMARGYDWLLYVHGSCTAAGQMVGIVLRLGQAMDIPDLEG